MLRPARFLRARFVLNCGQLTGEERQQLLRRVEASYAA